MEKIITKMWKNKLFVKTTLADLVSNFGDIVYAIALLNYIVLIPEKELAISIISIVTPLSSLIGFVTGYYADRANQRVRNILITLFLRTGLYIVLAFAMGQSPALWIVLLAIVINFVSDISGDYENGMYLKIRKNIIPDEDREAYTAVTASLFSSLGIVFKALGAVLIAVMTYQSLAFLNAFTFLFSAIVLVSIKSAILESISEKNDKKRAESEESSPQESDDEISIGKKQFSIKEIYLEQKASFKYLFSTFELKLCAIAWQIQNMLFAMLNSIIVLMLANGDSVLILSVAFTIASLQIAYAIGALTGSYLNIKFFKNVKLTTFLKFDGIFFVVQFIALYYRMIYIVLICAFFIEISTISTNSKMDSFVMNNYDEDKLGSIYGGIESYFCIGGIVSGFVFSAMVLTLSVDNIVLIAIGICILHLLYVFFSKNKTGVEEKTLQ